MTRELRQLATSATYRQGPPSPRQTTAAPSPAAPLQTPFPSRAPRDAQESVTPGLRAVGRAIVWCDEHLPAVSAELEIKITSEANTRGHWSGGAARSADQRRAGFRALLGARPVVAPVIVLLTRMAPRQLDSDNLARGFKAVRDGVADWLEIDDGDEEWVVFLAQQRQAHRHSVMVEIFEARHG